MPSRPQTVELDLPFERALPDRLRPMLPMAAAAPFDSADYAFDVAWDGVRALASVDRGRVGIWGRTLLDLTGRYPEVQVLADLLPPETIVDGELIVTDPEGRPDSVALARRQQAARPEAVARVAAAHPVTYVVHDLLYLRGRSWLKEPLVRRRPRLNDLLQSSGRIYVVEPVADDGLAFFDAAREKGLEGVIAKRFDSPYRAGQRHPDWLLIEAVRHQDFVVIGFIPEAGDRLLEALIVAHNDGRAPAAVETAARRDSASAPPVLEPESTEPNSHLGRGTSDPFVRSCAPHLGTDGCARFGARRRLRLISSHIPICVVRPVDPGSQPVK